MTALRLTVIPRAASAAALMGFAALNAAGALLLIHRGMKFAAIVALLPLVVIGVGLLVGSGRRALVIAALGLPLSFHALNTSHGGLFAMDIVVLLAIGASLAAKLRDAGTGITPQAGRYWPRLAATGAAFLPFAGIMVIDAYRGHVYYGTRIIGEPVRVVLYAAIGCAVTALSARDAYTAVVRVMYAATAWMSLNALYLMATGGSQVNTLDLSTGGKRILSGSVGTWMASALILALLNMQLASTARRRALDATIAALASFCVLIAYTRAVYLALVIPLVVVISHRRVRRAALGLIPLALPFLVIVALAVGHFAPNLAPTFIKRVTASPTNDANVQWRERSVSTVLEQFHHSPVYGVGFGRDSTIGVEYTDPTTGLVYQQQLAIGQDPHDSFIWLLAGGGVLALGSFFLVLGGYATDVYRRLRQPLEDHERVLMLWAPLSVLIVLVTTLSGPVLAGASDLLALWTLLVMPAVVPLRSRTRE